MDVEHPAIEGFTDRLTRTGAAGWAWSPADPHAVITIEAVIGGRIIGRAIANLARTDLAQAGLGHGQCGFNLVFAAPLAEGDEPSLVASLGAATARLPQASPSDIDGHVDSITARGATGWAWRPGAPEQPPLRIEAMLEGELVGTAIATEVRADIVAAGRAQGPCGFSIVFDRPMAPERKPTLQVVALSGAWTLPGGAWSHVIGHVERLDRQQATGWAWCPGAPHTAVRVEAMRGGTLVGQADADIFLSHLAEAGKGDGRHGFTIRFDPALQGEQPPTFRVAGPEGFVLLPGAGALPPAPAPPREDPAAIPVEGHVDHLERRGATGWAWCAETPDQALEIVATLDGRVCGRTRADRMRDDLAFWGKGSGRYGFALTFDQPLSGAGLPLIQAIGPDGATELPGADAFAEAQATPGETALAAHEPPDAPPAAAAAATEPPAIEGSVDALTAGGATGWVWAPASPDAALEVEATLEGRVIGRAAANRMRPDLASWGKGSGRYGFALQFTPRLTGPVPPVFRVLGHASGPYPLDSPATIALPPAPAEGPAAQTEGHVDHITRWEATGWVWRPDAPGEAVQVQAVLDGVVIGQAQADILRQDLADWGKGTGRYGFRLVFTQALTGGAAPVIRAMLADAVPLGGKSGLPPLTDAERRARPRGTVADLFRDHAAFTAPGPAFEEFDPAILQDLPEDAGPKPLLIAFYLPQFHPVAQNDAFWGKGFTEWRQLPRALPRFPGHYQPRIPRDLGFYNLLDAQALPRQFDLAQQAGIQAFAYYYYWFNRTRVLEEPLEQLMRSEEAVPFLIVWANENWTRTWDGSEASVLLRQDYRKADEPALLEDLARHFSDPRYVRLQGRPLFVLYNPANVPDARRTIARWRRQLARRFGVKPLMFMAQTFGERDPARFGLDGAIEFPPHKLTDELPGRPVPDAYAAGFTGRVIDYDDFAAASLAEAPPGFPLIKTIVPSWDNDSRRPNRGLTLEGASPARYEAWLRALLHRAIGTPVAGMPVVAVNAWNEWAEGAYLEPDVHFGAAYLNATARAVRAAMTDRLPPEAVLPRETDRRPRVSAILPNFNHGRFIVERIRSVQNQVIPPDEIIFLDDASTDDSLALARATLEDGAIPFRIIANERNSGGVFRQWMRGIDAARHELIWVAETDDSAHPEFLMHLLPSFRREDVRAAFGHITGIDPEGAPLPDLDGYLDGLHDFAWDRSAVVPAHRAFARDFAVKNIIPNASGLVFRRFALTEAERARLFEYRFAGDWYFYALMLRGGSLAFCRHARSFFRVNRDSASRSVFFTDRHLQEHRMVLQDIHAEYGVSAAALTAHVEALASILTDRSSAELGRLLAPGPVRRRRLRLCIAANGFAVGGGELLPLELANALKHLGHHVTYLVVERGTPGAGLRDRLHPDIPVLYWDDVAAAIPAFLADFGIEVFNSHNVSVDYRLTLLHQPFPVPYVGSLHGGYETVPELLTPELFRFLRETVDSWLYLSAKNIQPLLRLGVAPATLHHSFNAVPAFTGEWVDRTAFRAAHGIAADAFVFVLCSRAIEAKGWQVAIDAVESAVALARPVHLVLIGDGPAAPGIRRREATNPRVTLLGQVQEPVRYFRCFDAGLFPSTFAGETFPLFLLECFQAGLPVISSDIGEIPRIFGGSVARQPGILLPHDRGPVELADATRAALLKLVPNARLHGRLRANALAASKRFSLDELARSYEERFLAATTAANQPSGEPGHGTAAREPA